MVYIININGYQGIKGDIFVFTTKKEAENCLSEHIRYLKSELILQKLHPDSMIESLPSYNFIIQELKPLTENWRMKNNLDKVKKILLKYFETEFYLSVFLTSLEQTKKILDTRITLTEIIESVKEIKTIHFGYSEYKNYTYDIDECLPLIKAAIYNGLYSS